MLARGLAPYSSNGARSFMPFFCGSRVEGIRFEWDESHFCGMCQSFGYVLGDRALSRLLKDDWPRTLTELEERRAKS